MYVYVCTSAYICMCSMMLMYVCHLSVSLPQSCCPVQPVHVECISVYVSFCVYVSIYEHVFHDVDVCMSLEREPPAELLNCICKKHVCIHVCICHVCLYICLFVCMYACLHVHMFVCLHVYMYVCIYA